jgi:tripartite-type tricarboxylate transporter receptor subunit TctC
MAEFIAHAKKRPGLNYGTPGITTPNHLAGVLLGVMTGTELVHVGYKGTAPAVQDVIGGHLPAAIVGLSTALQFARSGQVKVLGIGSAKRSELAPELPTIAEGGVKGYDASYWYDITVARGVPAAVMSRLHAEITKAVQSREVRQTLMAQGFEPMVASQAEYRRILQAEHAKWEPLIKAHNIRID